MWFTFSTWVNQVLLSHEEGRGGSGGQSFPRLLWNNSRGMIS